MPAPKKKTSNWSLLNRWLYDGSRDTIIPEDVVNDKGIGQMFILYHFQCSSFIVVISKLFNNWSLFNLDRVEVLKFAKKAIQTSGYKPPFIQRTPKTKSKISDILKLKYPYLKREEIYMLVEFIDVSDQKDSIYEMFGLYKPKSKKTSKAQQEKMKKESKKELKKVQESAVSLDSIMENFS